MRKVILICILLLPFSLFAQKEIVLSFGSGIFRFVGEPTAEKSSIIIDEDEFYYPAFAPYGKNPSISYNLSGSFQKVDTTKFIYGAKVSLDYLTNIIYVDQVELDSYYNEINIRPGKVFSTIYEISFSPYVGKRFKINNFNVDIIGGLEFAIPLQAVDYTKVTGNDGSKHLLSSKRELSTLTFDFRPTIKLACSYKRIGIFGQFSNGLKNYASDNYFGPVNARLKRFGINYLIYKS